MQTAPPQKQHSEEMKHPTARSAGIFGVGGNAGHALVNEISHQDALLPPLPLFFAASFEPTNLHWYRPVAKFSPEVPEVAPSFTAGPALGGSLSRQAHNEISAGEQASQESWQAIDRWFFSLVESVLKTNRYHDGRVCLEKSLFKLGKWDLVDPLDRPSLVD